MEGCCSNEKRSNAEGEELFDPTMAECCIRDAIQQRKIETAKAHLRSVDVSMKALDIRNQVFLPNDTQHSTPQEHSEDEDSDDDPVLKEIRDRRIRELEKRVWSGKEPAANSVTTCRDADALEETLRSDHAPSIVHIAVPSSKASCCFDELLDRLAPKYSETRFLRLVYAKNTPNHFLKMGSKGPPAVSCFSSGSLVGQACLSSFLWDGDLLEEKMMRFFRKLHVLKKRGEGGQESESSLSSGDDDEDPWLDDPCDVCGRRYPHKHFGPADISNDKFENFHEESDGDE
ncbi:hypothetical protein BSKO_08066 [Bryopsis sp. KO-2023]|nr:hypothetical protein BSKO_08066 [Bryopsis sp. KO-2023]